MEHYVYLAGPITGLTYNEATDWRESYRAPDGWVALSPMRGKEKFDTGERLTSTFEQGESHAAFTRDLSDIRRSDAIIVNLTGATHASIGTMCEMGYAYALGKQIIVVGARAEHYLKELSPGWFERTPNPHDHLFVHEMASCHMDTLAQANTRLEMLRCNRF